MTNFDHDDLPPDLADLGRRMRDERPVAEDASLDRMMQRARTANRKAPRRAPRRAFAVSLATMLAMVSVTGVAAAALFGMNFSTVSNALTSSSQKVGTASTQALRAPATSTSSPRLPAIGNLGARPAAATPAGDGTAPSANQLPGNLPNAGHFQYGPGRLVCRILRALGLNRIANLLGC